MDNELDFYKITQSRSEEGSFNNFEAIAQVMYSKLITFFAIYSSVFKSNIMKEN